MSGFSDAWRRAGGGTDPDGDRARREALASAAYADAVRERAERRRPPQPVDHPDHQLTGTSGRSGTTLECSCGRWDAWYNGPRSYRGVLADHAAHVTAELAAAGPLRVTAERLDHPPALPPGETP